MAIQTGLEGKPWWWGFVVGVPLAGVLLFLGHWQLWSPKKDEIARLQRHLTELEAQIQEGRAAKAKLPQFREEVRRLELELDKLLRILPARRNTEDLLRRLRALTEQGDFALNKFTPAGLVDREFYSEWPITINLDGTYHNLALLFDRVGRFSRIINIDNLVITAIRKNANTINANFKATTFVYRENAPPAAEPPKPAARRPIAPPSGDGGGE
jgi:type IV pilus assembly protein PilO